MAIPTQDEIDDLARTYGVIPEYVRQYYEAREAPPPAPGQLTDNEIREQAARLGVNYQFLRQHYEQTGAIARAENVSNC